MTLSPFRQISRKTVEIMKEWKEDIDYELIHRLVVHIIKEDKSSVDDGLESGSILIFVPGWSEIRWESSEFIYSYTPLYKGYEILVPHVISFLFLC